MTQDLEKRRRRDREAKKRWRQNHPDLWAQRRVALRPRWRAANRRYAQRHPERVSESARRYIQLHPERRRATELSWRDRNRFEYDAINIRYELAERLGVAPGQIPNELIERRAILRVIKRDLRKLLP